MALFLVAYRPEFPEDNLPAVEALVKSWGAKTVCGSVWIVNMVSSEKFIFEAIYERINQLVDSVIIARIDPSHCLAHRAREDLSELGIPISGR